jgi:hypothetical protein
MITNHCTICIWGNTTRALKKCIPYLCSSTWYQWRQCLYCTWPPIQCIIIERSISNWTFILPDVPIDKISNDKLWKLKIPLRIKVFGWYLRKGVVLTKDNLAKRNWHGSKKCVFCHQDETIKHLFFQCRLARSIWSVIQVASTLFPPRSITNIFGNWLNGIDNRFKKHIRVGAIAFIWSLWLCRNDKVFNDKNSSFLQVIYRATGTLRLWSSLQHLQDRDLYTEVCARLEATARDTFSQHGWPHSLRISASS